MWGGTILNYLRNSETSDSDCWIRHRNKPDNIDLDLAWQRNAEEEELMIDLRRLKRFRLDLDLDLMGLCHKEHAVVLVVEQKEQS